MSKEYFQTKSKTFAYALNYLGFSFYKFKNNDYTIYSFKASEKLYKTIKELENIKFK